VPDMIIAYCPGMV